MSNFKTQCMCGATVSTDVTSKIIRCSDCKKRWYYFRTYRNIVQNELLDSILYISKNPCSNCGFTQRLHVIQYYDRVYTDKLLIHCMTCRADDIDYIRCDDAIEAEVDCILDEFGL